MLLKSFTALWLANVANGDRLRPQLNPLRLHALDDRPCEKSNDGSVCRSDGLWRPQQCDKDGNCWCVNALNGQPDQTTKTNNINQQNCGGQCLGGQWTRWFNTDHPLSPTGELRKGDLETLDRARLESRRVCDYPIGFKIAVDDGNNGQGLDVAQFNDEIHLTYDGPTMGVRCYNGEQTAKCKDYKIKFCCALNSICHWSGWAEWSTCSRTCGSTGVRHRARQVLYQPDNIHDCPGRDYEVEECGNDECCAVDCSWSSWTDWSECSNGCHGGHTTRTRHKEVEESCGGMCTGRPEQIEQCTPDCGIYGVWNGEGCVCDAGWLGQCCRKEDPSGVGIQADDAGFDIGILGNRRSGDFAQPTGTDFEPPFAPATITTGSAADNERCQKLVNRSPPQNGKLNCQRHRQTPTIGCEVTCNRGFEFIERPAHRYFCHPSGVTFTAPPGKSFDWPDCTRRHDKKGIKNEIWFEYQLTGDEVNCKDNIHEIKKRFRSADGPWLASSQIPGFSFFTRIRLKCGNKAEVLRVGKDNELEEVPLDLTAGSSASPWARNSRITAGGMGVPGFSFDRIGNQDRQQEVQNDETYLVKQLLDKKELMALKRKNKRKDKRIKKQVKRKERKTERGNRNTRDADDDTVIIQLRLIQFPIEHHEDLQNLTEVSRSSLIHHLRSKANHGKMNLEKDGKILGRLKKVEITKFPIQQDRCLNGEVSRLSADNEDICVACPAGTYQIHNECAKCSIGHYQPKTAQIDCRKCHQDKTTYATGSKRSKECV